MRTRQQLFADVFEIHRSTIARVDEMLAKERRGEKIEDAKCFTQDELEQLTEKLRTLAERLRGSTAVPKAWSSPVRFAFNHSGLTTDPTWLGAFRLGLLESLGFFHQLPTN